MATIERFEDLDIWKEAILLSKEIIQLSKKYWAKNRLQTKRPEHMILNIFQKKNLLLW